MARTSTIHVNPTRNSRSNYVSVGVGMLLAACIVLAPDAGAQEKPTPEKFQALIDDLASDSFASRERAAKKLGSLGKSARPYLEKAAKSSNLELRSRARRILNEEIRRQMELELRVFLTDSAGERDYSFPGWEKFRKLVGSGRLERQLFAELIRHERGLLMAIEAKTNLRGAVDDRFIQIEAMRTTQGSYPQAQTVAAVVFACTDIRPDRLILSNQSRMLRRATGTVQSSRYRRPIEKMITALITRDNVDPQYRFEMMSLAESFKLGDTVMELAREFLKNASDAQRIAYLRYVLDYYSKYGTEKDIALLLPMFTDQTIAINVKPPVQIRDLALATALRLKKVKLKDFGVEFVGQVGFFPNQGFPSAEARQAAFKKWEMTFGKDAKGTDAKATDAKGPKDQQPKDDKPQK